MATNATWTSAEQPVTERRLAWDGEAYLFEEFLAHYGIEKVFAIWENLNAWTVLNSLSA